MPALLYITMVAEPVTYRILASQRRRESREGQDPRETQAGTGGQQHTSDHQTSFLNAAGLPQAAVSADLVQVYMVFRLGRLGADCGAPGPTWQRRVSEQALPPQLQHSRASRTLPPSPEIFLSRGGSPHTRAHSTPTPHVNSTRNAPRLSPRPHGRASISCQGPSHPNALMADGGWAGEWPITSPVPIRWPPPPPELKPSFH